MPPKLPIASIAFALAATTSAAPASADYEAAVQAYLAGDYELAFSEWLVEAEGGDPRAQYAIGAMYRGGEGVAIDAAEAARWYQRAADQGFAAAQFNLGVMLQKGEGLARDDAAAAIWYREAALQGFAQAQFNLAVLYQLGLGVDRDYFEAAVWYLLAAGTGDPIAAQRYRLMIDALPGEQADAVNQRANELMPAR